MSEARLRDGQGALANVREARTRWRAFDQSQDEGRKVDLSIGISSTFTVDPLVPLLGAHLLEKGVKPSLCVGPFNQIFSLCRSPESFFERECDAIVILWRLEDLMLKEIESHCAADRGAIELAREKVKALTQALAELRSKFSGMIVVNVPAFTIGLSVPAYSVNGIHEIESFYRIIAAQFAEAAKRIDGIHLLETESIQRTIGLEATYDARNWYLYRIPYTDKYFFQLGKILSRVVAASRRAPKKCIVLDCDNTMWGGVIGEDGLDGIHVGDEFPGSAFRDFQKLLLSWQRQGVLLAVASKNNEADALEVFDKHPGMVVRKDHLTAWQINWRPKAEGLVEIARTLNIGTDSLVFIDDSKMEIDYVRSVLPEVTCILMPEDPAEIMATFNDLDLFDKLEISDEDLRRHEMMVAERQRNALVKELSHDEFLATLELQVDLFVAKPEDLGRITQLINKTNQFNPTTRRYTPEQLDALLATPGALGFQFRLRDRFGDNGLVSAMILTPHAGRSDCLDIDTWVMSCRVFGRQLEHEALNIAVEAARRAGVDEIVATYAPTPKNGVISELYRQLGFRAVASSDPPSGVTRWSLRLADYVPHQTAITRDTP